MVRPMSDNLYVSQEMCYIFCVGHCANSLAAYKNTSTRLVTTVYH